MSASGVACNSKGSGDCDGCGVGNGRASSGVLDERTPRTGALLLRFRGDALLEGDSGSGIAVSSGSKISEGSMFSFARLFFARPPVRGVAVVVVVFRLEAGAFRGLRLGAGVKSSSLSSSILGPVISSSPSESTTVFLLVAAARLEGLTGDSDILIWSQSACQKLVLSIITR